MYFLCINSVFLFLLFLLAIASIIDCWSISNFLITGSQASIQYADTVAIGAQKGLNECKRQFTYERWPCPESVLSNSIFRNSLPINREIAFVQAIISAGITYTVTKNCNSGAEESCGCLANNHYNSQTAVHQQLNGLGSNDKDNNNDVSEVKNHFRWGGCSDDIEFGSKIAQLYLDHQEVGLDLRGQIRRHNNEAGRNAIKETMIRTCKCHGFSGACSKRTCWMKLNDFREVGSYLKKAYKKAAQIDSRENNDRISISLSGLLTSVPKWKLAYSLDSPDYCRASNLTLGSSGTIGRKCSMKKGKHITTDERKSCRNLCKKCGHTVKMERRIVEASCNCKFKFCCEVQCEKCTKEEFTYVCVERDNHSAALTSTSTTIPAAATTSSFLLTTSDSLSLSSSNRIS